MAVGLYSGVSGLALGIGLYKNVSGLWGGASGLINGFGGSGPFPGASLYLDFLSGTLDPRITFSRGSNATLVDATGKIVYAPANLLRYSEQLDNGSSWTNVSGATVTANTSVAPDGTTTADTVNFSATNANRVEQLAGTAGNGETMIFSIWLRGSGSMRINVGTDTGVGGSSEPTINLTSTWTRYSATVTYSAPTGNRRAMIIWRTGDTATSAEAWGAQLEPVTYQTTPSTYVATTASAYYGPRFDYDPVTLAPKGLLIEEARTNLQTYSSDFSNVIWSKTNITVTAAATASPDGTTNAQKLAATATAATVINATPVAVAATSATYSIYVKQGTGASIGNTFLIRNSTTATVLLGGTINYATGAWTYSTGSTGVTVSNAGNGWWRIQMSATTGITSGDLIHGYVGWGGASATIGDHIFAYGAQLEAGSFATSYIPTVASTVTRSADVATMTGTNFSSWYNQSEGTMIVGYSRIQTTDTFGMVWEVKPTSASSSDRINVSASNVADPRFQAFVGGVSQLDTTTTFGPFALGVVVNTCLAYKSGNLAAVRNGSAPSTSATTFAAPSYTNLQIGGTDNAIFGPAASSFLNGHIRQIAYYNTRLPNAQLQTLTAPSLATTLSLSFTNQAYTVGV